MASIEKYHKTGEGDSVGFDVNSRTETYTLVVDTVLDDPIAKFRALLPIESQHVSDRNLFVIRHNTIERGGPLLWRMSADYEMPAARGIAGLGDWLVTVRFNTGSEMLLQEIPDQDDNDARRQIIGPLKYDVIAAPEGTTPAGATHKTDSAAPVFLKQVDGVVIPKGIPRIAGDTSIVLRAKTNVMSAPLIREIADMKRGTNDDPFLNEAFPVGTLLFSSFNIVENVGTIDGNPSEQFLYDNTLEFAYNAEGHSPVKRTDTHLDDKNFEQLVVNIETGAPEERSFRRYPRIVFADLLKKFPVKKGYRRT